MDIWISEAFYFYFEENKLRFSFIFCEFDRFCLVDSKSVFEIYLFSDRIANSVKDVIRGKHTILNNLKPSLSYTNIANHPY